MVEEASGISGSGYAVSGGAAHFMCNRRDSEAEGRTVMIRQRFPCPCGMP